MAVSVIVPVYNTAQYIGKCLESIMAQTYRDLEIICVDDGSTDGSSEILDEYEQKDARIRVIHKENGGSVTARKAGISAATGEYIGYVDSDDYIEPDMYEALMEIAGKYCVDMVTSGYYLEGLYTTYHVDTVEEGLYEKKDMYELRNNLIYCGKKRETGLRGSLCCKLFRASVMKKVQMGIPDDITTAEDKSCLLNFILECGSVFVWKKAYYHWVIRGDSKSHRSNDDYLIKVDHVCRFWESLYQHPNFTDRMRTQSEIYFVELIFLGINKRMGFKNRNMLWIDPYWMDSLPLHSRIVLYGGGELGEKYRKQLFHKRPDVTLVSCVDSQYRTLSSADFLIDPPEVLGQLEYDRIVITIKNRGKAESVREQLVSEGIPAEKIVWREQPEIYWKFIEAEGMIEE